MKRYLCAFLVILFMFLPVSCSYAKLADDMTITGTFPKGYTVNNWYSANVTASGGVTDYTFNITGGSLPPGFFIRQDGSRFYLEGIPNAAGTWKFKLRVTDRRDCYAERELSFTVSDEHYEANDMSISGPFKASGEAGTWYQSYVTVSGGSANYTFNISGTLPAGLYIRQDGSRFYLEGVPSKAEECTFKLKITDRRNSYTEKSSTVSITGSYTEPTEADDMSILGDFTTERRVNDGYSSSSAYVNGYTGSVTWSLIDGTLPPGLSLQPYSNNNIYLQGIPNKAGTYTFTLRATDSRNKYVERPFTVKFSDTPTEADDMSILGDFTTERRVNDIYGSSVYVSGYTGSVTWSLIDGTLPPGLSLRPYGSNNYYIYLQGIPNKAGTYTFTLRATDSRNKYIERPFTVTFSDTPTEADDMSINGDFTTGLRINDSYSSTVSVNGEVGSVTWSLVSGALPPGLSLRPYGSNNYYIYLQGIPNKAGTYTFTLRATDSRNKYIERPFTVTFSDTPTEADDMSIIGDFTTEGQVNESYSSSVYVSGNAGSVTWSLIDGTLPPGLSLRPFGGNNYYIDLQGIPNKAGTYTFTLRATDRRNKYVERSFTVTIEGTEKEDPTSTTDMSLSGTLKDGYTVSNWYSSGVQVNGGTSDYTYRITSGSLPPGFYIRQDGRYFYVEGIPNKAGTYKFKLRVIDQRNTYAERELTLKINSEHYSASDMSLTGKFPEAYGVNNWYSASVQANGGVTDYTYNITSGDLPTWFYIRQDGRNFYLEGIPANPGTYSFTLKVTDRRNAYTERTFTMTINARETDDSDPIEITTSHLDHAGTGKEYSQTLKATGTVTSWKVTQGSLPKGLSLSESTGIISGVTADDAIEHNAPKAKTYSFEVTASNSSGGSASKSFTIDVYEPIKITTSSLPNAKVGEEYSATIEASGTKASVWLLRPAIDVPSWLEYTSSGNTCTLSGKPTYESSYSFKAACGNIYCEDEKKFTLVVDPETKPVTKPSISGKLPGGVIKAKYTGTPKVSGGTAPYTWKKYSGTLPTGLSINKTTGSITGTPTKSGSFTFKIKVTDANGLSATKSYTVKITKPSISGTLSNGNVRAIYIQRLTATGGTLLYTWAVSDGNLPAGLILDSLTGIVLGIPSKAGTYTFKVKVTDANKATATKSYTITITKPSISGTLKSGTVGTSYSKTLKATGGIAPYTWTKASGTLPSGLKLGSTTGKISGKPTKAGKYTFKIKAEDANGAAVTKSFTVTIKEASSSSPNTQTDETESLYLSEDEDEKVMTEEEKMTANEQTVMMNIHADTETNSYSVTELQVLSDDLISRGTERDSDLVTVIANRPVRFIIGEWNHKVSNECVYINDEPFEAIEISEGMFTLPAELVHDDFKICVKAGFDDSESELASEELYVSTED